MSHDLLSTTLVLIPALNEAESISATIRLWRDLGARHIRVVDNGSEDGTAAIARCAGADVVLEPRRGYGAACWTGLQHVSESIEWILFSSADGSDRLSPEELQAWQQTTQAGADLIVGDRFTLPEARQHLKWVQRLGNSFCCRLLWAGWGRLFHDLGSLRLIRYEAWRLLQLRDRGFGWNVEMQVRAVEERLTVVELPVRYYARGQGVSKISGSVRGTLKAAAGMTGMIARLWVRRFSGYKPAPAVDASRV